MMRRDEEATKTYRCPCCNYKTLFGRGQDEICSVCFWHDDGQDEDQADEVRGGPNKDLSLTAARANFKAFGAWHPDFTSKVRKPTPDEI